MTGGSEAKLSGTATDRAATLRLEGRFEDALAEIDGDSTPEATIERMQILADEHLFARDRGAEIAAGLDQIAEQARTSEDSTLEAFVCSRRGLALHVQFLANPDAGESPEEMALFERALRLRQEVRDLRGEAESFFHIGLVEQMARKDEARALDCFRRSYELAKEAKDGVLMSYAIRHIGYVQQAAGNRDTAQEAFTESLELRKAAGWRPGVAAAQLALASVLADEGEHKRAQTLAQNAADTMTELRLDRFRGLVAEELEELLSADLGDDIRDT